MKTMFNCSKAIEILNGLNVPSEIINSVEIAEAIRMGSKALEMQINIGQMLQDFKDNYDESNTYSENLVMDIICDGYMFAEDNEEGEIVNA